jgi:hypothetical protein
MTWFHPHLLSYHWRQWSNYPKSILVSNIIRPSTNRRSRSAPRTDNPRSNPICQLRTKGTCFPPSPRLKYGGRTWLWQRCSPEQVTGQSSAPTLERTGATHLGVNDELNRRVLTGDEDVMKPDHKMERSTTIFYVQWEICRCPRLLHTKWGHRCLPCDLVKLPSTTPRARLRWVYEIALGGGEACAYLWWVSFHLKLWSRRSRARVL